MLILKYSTCRIRTLTTPPSLAASSCVPSHGREDLDRVFESSCCCPLPRFAALTHGTRHPHTERDTDRDTDTHMRAHTRHKTPHVLFAVPSPNSLRSLSPVILLFLAVCLQSSLYFIVSGSLGLWCFRFLRRPFLPRVGVNKLEG